MPKNALLACGTVLVVLLAACSGTDEQTVRHLVIAELIEREHLSEGYVRIQEVRIESQHHAVVKAKVLGQDGRAATWHTYRCELERDAGRWAIRQVRPE